MGTDKSSPLRCRDGRVRKLLWPRKKIEINLLDLLRGLIYLVVGRSCGACQRAIDAAWRSSAYVGISERACFDRYLSALQLPPGSEVLVSAINIEGMFRILHEHGLRVRSIDIDPETLEMNLEQANELVSPHTKAVLFAHLFGAQSNLRSLSLFCREHKLLLWEDCAQAFDGRYRGVSNADLRLFSFGPIKSFTSLQGGIAMCSDPTVLQRMRDIDLELPRQASCKYGMRLLKYLGLSLLANPIGFRWFTKILFGSYEKRDSALSKMFRNTKQTALLESIRCRPCVALIRLLAYRISHSGAAANSTEASRGRKAEWLAARLTRSLGHGLSIPGCKTHKHGYWVFPIVLQDREHLIRALDQAGFDATARCQLVMFSDLIGSSNEETASRAGNSLESNMQAPPSQLTPQAENLLSGLVFLPCYHTMPFAEVERLAEKVEHVLAGSSQRKGGCSRAA